MSRRCWSTRWCACASLRFALRPSGTVRGETKSRHAHSLSYNPRSLISFSRLPAP